MKWLIPAKTFLIGEYVALQGGPALVITTDPCFELSIDKGSAFCNFPINSPAYNLWKENLSIYNYTFTWHDPYSGLGGMGASSAQFLGAYYAKNYIRDISANTEISPEKLMDFEDLLKQYFKYAWNGKGMMPSGYDVIAQSMRGVVYIDNQNKQYKNFPWPFSELSFILIHTGKKQATHIYLENLVDLDNLTELFDIAQNSCDAFFNGDADSFVNSINNYYSELCKLNLVAQHTREIIDFLKTNHEIQAIKGCGALGADVLLLVVKSNNLINTISKLNKSNLNVISVHE